MIDKGSFEKAVGAAGIFAAKGLRVEPVGGTPLALLVAQTNNLGVDIPPMDSSDDFTEGDGGMLAFTSSNDLHNSIFDDYVNTLSTSMSFQINNAKNIVNPIIQDAVEKITKVTQETNLSEYSFEIVLAGLPEPIKNATLADEITKNAQGSLMNPSTTITLPATTFEEITAGMVTGSELFDNVVRAWLSEKGEAWIMEFWANTFANIHTTNISTRPDLIQYLKGKEAIDRALGVFLITRRLIEGEVPETANVTLTTWLKTVRDYITVSCIVLDKEIQFYSSATSNEKLVSSYNDLNKKVYVFEKTYTDYINNGGKNELIFGAIVDGVVPFFKATIDQNAERYQSVWDRYASINRESVRIKTFNFFKEIVESVLVNQLATLAPFEEEKATADSTFIQAISKNYQQAIRNLKIEDMGNVYHTVMTLICECRFPYTSAYVFLDAINDICKDSPETDIREAALIATIEYICDHMAEQMTVVDNQ